MIFHSLRKRLVLTACQIVLLTGWVWAGAACRSAQKLQLRKLPNYAENQPTILFLDFAFESTKQPDHAKVTLANAIAGRGEMKTIEPFSHSNRQVETVFRNASGAVVRSVQYDHPLYRIVEYPTEDKSFRVRGLSLSQSNLSIRFTRQPEIVSLDIYSLIDNKRRKLYTLRFIP